MGKACTKAVNDPHDDIPANPRPKLPIGGEPINKNPPPAAAAGPDQPAA